MTTGIFDATQRAELQGYINAAQMAQDNGDSAGAAAALEQYYSVQAAWGRGYPNLALGVITDTGFEGKVAIGVLNNIAGHDVIGLEKSALMVKLATADNNIIQQDGYWPNIGQIEDYHYQAYKDQGLPVEAWGGTLFAFFKENWDGGTLTPTELSGAHGTLYQSLSVAQIQNNIIALVEASAGASGEALAIGMFDLVVGQSPDSVIRDGVPAYGSLKALFDLITHNTPGSVSFAALASANCDNPFLSSFYVGKAIGQLIASQRDPLVIDLSGAGLNIVPQAQSGAYFDYAGKGFAQQTSWLGQGSGFLAVAQPDGTVHNGADLVTSFAQLAAMDSNGDGVIDANDPGFAKLVVWQDASGDGVCTPDEVQTLAQIGIASLSLRVTTVNDVETGATIVGTAVATMADGTTREVAAADLNVSTLYTKYVGAWTPDPDTAGLPDLRGYGQLPDLSVAMSLDPALKGLVQQLGAVNPDDELSLLAA